MPLKQKPCRDPPRRMLETHAGTRACYSRTHDPRPCLAAAALALPSEGGPVCCVCLTDDKAGFPSPNSVCVIHTHPGLGVGWGIKWTTADSECHLAEKAPASEPHRPQQRWPPPPPPPPPAGAPGAPGVYWTSSVGSARPRHPLRILPFPG